MKKIKKNIYDHPLLTSFIGGIIFLVVIFLLYHYLFSVIGQNKFSSGDLILGATFFGIIWYSLETRLLRIATNITNAIQAEPFLVLQNETRNGKDDLYIINYGKGIAFNTRIDIKNIQGKFNFSIFDKNPLHYEDKKFLILDSESVNKNIEADITLIFDKNEGNTIVGRKRVYRIFKSDSGWQISFLG